MTQTRAILLTPPGSAAIAVVRLLGAEIFLRNHFSKPLPRLRCVHGELKDGDVVLDDAVVVVAPDGALADLNLHGGPWVVESVLQLLRREGFEIIVPEADQPLPMDAVDGSTPLEREVLAYLPLAKTEQAIRILLAQPQAWRKLTDSLPLRESLSAIVADRSLEYLLHPPTVAIVGPPNVGKSTLANQLFAQERSITADLAGTTRDWIGELANIDGLAVLLIDTPGQRDTADDIERAAIDRSRDVIRRADLTIIVADPQTPSAQISGSDAVLRVLNKCDRLSPGMIDPGDGLIRTIATTGQGVDALRIAIRRHFGCEDLSPDHPRCWTQRQRDLLRANNIGAIIA